MKNNKNLIKVLSLVISLALLVCAAFAISSLAADGEEQTEASLSIFKKNVSYLESPTMVFAVAYDGVDAANVKLNVWYGAYSGNPTVIDEYEWSETIQGKNCLIFNAGSKLPKNIADNFYVQAVCGDVKSEIVRYSILEFAYDGIFSTDDEAEIARYNSIIDYAASVQYWLDVSGKYDGKHVGEYVYIDAEGVDLGDGFSKGMYPAGKEVVLNANNVESWIVTSYNDGAKTVQTYPNGKAITVNESISCQAVKAPSYSFSDGVVPTGITTSLLSGSSLAIATENDNNYLAFTAAGSSAEYINIPLMNDSNEAVTVFETDVRISGISSDNLRLYFKSGTTTAFSLHIQGNSAGYASMRIYSNKYGGLNYTVDPAIIPVANYGSWVNMRIEFYRDAEGEQTVFKLYLNGDTAAVIILPTIAFCVAGEHDSTLTIDNMDIRAHGAAKGTFSFDNFSFYNCSKAYVYEMPGIRNNLESGNLSTSNNSNSNTASKTGDGVAKTVINKDGYTTTAQQLTSAEGNASQIRVINSSTATTKTYNTFSATMDLKLDFNTSDSVINMGIGSHNNNTCHAALFTLATNEDGFVTITNATALTTSETVVTKASASKWFNLRIEYSYVMQDTILVRVYIDGELAYVTNAFYRINSSGDSAFPIYNVYSLDGKYYVYNGANIQWGVSRVSFDVNTSSDATVTIDNIFARYYTLTIPELNAEDYNSYYAPATE